MRPEVFIGYKKKAGQRSRVMAYGAVISYTLNKVFEPLIGSSPSAQTVSNIVDELDKDVRKFHKRRIEDKYKYLFLME